MSGTNINVREWYGKRRRRSRFFLAVSVFAGSVLLTTGALWVLAASPFFSIRNVAVSGVDPEYAPEVIGLARADVLNRSAVARLLGFDNILVWPANISTGSLAFAPKLRDATIRKDYRERTVSIAVAERAPIGVWCFTKREPQECFEFDDQGVMIGRSLAAQGNLIPTVDDEEESGIGLGAPVLPSDRMPNLISIFRVLKESKVSVQAITERSPDLEELAVELREGPELFFSLRFPSSNAGAVIASLRARGEFGKLKYVDFRVENRAYYK